MRSYKYVGQKVSKVTVLSKPERRPGRSGIIDWFYACQCECGRPCYVSQTEISSVARGALKSPRTLSCGCHREDKALAGALVDYRQSYKDAAKRRGYNFELSQVEFTALATASCLYCGLSPNKPCTPYTNRLIRTNEKRRSTEGKYRGTEESRAAVNELLVNGVDRLDNSLGYSVENSVPCCTACNRAKNALGLVEFTRWLAQVKSTPLPEILIQYLPKD